ncbi:MULTISPECIES: hypothetical protein [unclassified Mesorhizobium]|uniref:hypothetical protein n=1 Tax=unclassified Mesorhizobium TaxID=325217 RepID=UPI0003CE54BD|nr:MULTISPECIES: hypothetical protein [unclassified Mesorhizobium]ESW67022.1 hypothetical protein X773_30405 [Mesorhizobium sp. LSJC285A00]ESX22253.1 hypothetical protein X766_04225 [Mesorhizobium sp. LSJC255A00]ESX30660.1 hypothetical protein X765_08730 [Mesorhizobium sp. LSHC440B00]ESX37702.1 hypothetical protein X763_08510 [Mesorhizobium sp. LSHC432A00]ESX41058.1 hypothetical protein X764_18655 [Mesorhizobium sp. LSHC440A00]
MEAGHHPILSAEFSERVEELIKRTFYKYTYGYYTDVFRFIEESPELTFHFASSLAGVTARIAREGKLNNITLAPMSSRDARYILCHEYAHLVYDKIAGRLDRVPRTSREVEEAVVRSIADRIFVRRSWVDKLERSYLESPKEFSAVGAEVIRQGNIPHRVFCRASLLLGTGAFGGFVKMSSDNQLSLFDGPTKPMFHWFMRFAGKRAEDGSIECRYHETRSENKAFQIVSTSLARAGRAMPGNNAVRLLSEVRVMAGVIHLEEEGREVHLVPVFD